MRKPTFVAAVAALLALAGMVAYATIPDSKGVIHGCYKTQNGQLRVIDSGSCDSSETALSWSQTRPQGPPGPQGLQGPQGPAGPQGPPGPAEALDAKFATGFNADADGQVHTVVSEDLPAGTCSVVGSVTLNLHGDDGSATCYLRLNGITLDQQTFDFSDGEVEHDAATLMTDASGPLTAHIACSMANDDPDAFISNGIKARLLATKVSFG